MSSPFSKAAVNVMRRLYPESLADKSFDNTGLLLESPFNHTRRQKNSILLTIDLTKAVADEAIERRDSIIISYHPIIFRGLKSITFADSQQQSLLRLAAAGISVYSPHTAVDAAPGGLGDWLADILTGTPEGEPADMEDPFVDRPKRPTYRLQQHPSQLSIPHRKSEPHTRAPITPSATEGAGMGRVIHFQSPQPLGKIIDRVAVALNRPRGIPVAIPQSSRVEDIEIRSAAVCAGSGGGVFSSLKEHVDLLLTGELTHHEALAAIEKGQSVISLFHSNSERGYLAQVLRPQLEEVVKEEWQKVIKEAKEEGVGGEEGWGEVLLDESVEVFVSERDRDPYGIMIADAE